MIIINKSIGSFKQASELSIINVLRSVRWKRRECECFLEEIKVGNDGQNYQNKLW